MTNPEKIKQILLSEIEKMNRHREDFCKHPGIGFTFTRNPKDAESYYTPNGRSQKGYNQMYLVPLYDLLNKVYTDAVIQPMRKRNEFAALYELIDRHTPCNGTIPVFIADRGFHAYNVFAHAIENNALHTGFE